MQVRVQSRVNRLGTGRGGQVGVQSRVQVGIIRCGRRRCAARTRQVRPAGRRRLPEEDGGSGGGGEVGVGEEVGAGRDDELVAERMEGRNLEDVDRVLQRRLVERLAGGPAEGGEELLVVALEVVLEHVVLLLLRHVLVPHVLLLHHKRRRALGLYSAARRGADFRAQDAVRARRVLQLESDIVRALQAGAVLSALPQMPLAGALRARWRALGKSGRGTGLLSRMS